jgi:hypothetical protein
MGQMAFPSPAGSPAAFTARPRVNATQTGFRLRVNLPRKKRPQEQTPPLKSLPSAGQLMYLN